MKRVRGYIWKSNLYEVLPALNISYYPPSGYWYVALAFLKYSYRIAASYSKELGQRVMRCTMCDRVIPEPPKPKKKTYYRRKWIALSDRVYIPTYFESKDAFDYHNANYVKVSEEWETIEI